MGCLTVRVVVSFEHRNIKNIVLHGVDFYQDTLLTIWERVGAEVSSQAGAHKKYDTMKFHTHAHGAKPDLVVDTADTRVYAREDYDKVLCVLDLASESEVSLFVLGEYETYRGDKRHMW
ncbi:MAG: uncharacterized protein A8A55_0014 [Amphiamblys sp. WSBS2006]|nr:MAG: uncharacterized protein A8A55_0014 [Amphiamblys sp. WSBS2006]